MVRMPSTLIDIAAGADGGRVRWRKAKREAFIKFFRCLFSFAKKKRSTSEIRRVVHSVKVGFAVVLASLVYLLDPLYNEVGDNAMWSIITVVVTFEFFAGATMNKGLNRGLGTILGGGLGCLAAALAQEVGEFGHVLVILTSVFIFGTGASYSRLVPSIKKRYDYGAMIFILTFNMVVVSGVRIEKVLELAWERLLTIIIGFCVCVFISLLVFPMWPSDELHDSLASRFRDLSSSIEGFLDEYFSSPRNKPIFSFSDCKLMLHSKLRDETLVNFAKWEPWHGRFGIFHPWDKYVEIGELLRDLTATILFFEPCLKTSREESELVKQSIEEACTLTGTTLAWILRELGDSLMRMRKSDLSEDIKQKLRAVKRELSLASQKVRKQRSSEGCVLASVSFLFTLIAMVNKVEQVVKEVEQLTKLDHSATQVAADDINAIASFYNTSGANETIIASVDLQHTKKCDQLCC